MRSSLRWSLFSSSWWYGRWAQRSEMRTAPSIVPCHNFLAGKSNFPRDPVIDRVSWISCMRIIATKDSSLHPTRRDLPLICHTRFAQCTPYGIILPLNCSCLTKDVILKPGNVSELADEHDLGSCAERREGSIPSVPTNLIPSSR